MPGATIGCDYCSGEDDKPGWKGNYSDDGYIGYTLCDCNMNAIIPQTETNTVSSMQSYVKWLIEDQCRGLLRLRYEDISKSMGMSRPTLDKRIKDYGSFTINEIEMLENYLKYIKSALLVTESVDR